VLLDVSENIANLNQEMNVDRTQMTAEEVNLVSCTPLLGRRNLQQEADKVP
jgi:hypothetical protein